MKSNWNTPYGPWLPLGVALVVALTLLSGYLQGTMARRWGIPPDMQAMGKALEAFPEQIGPWHAESEDELSENIVNVLECSGYVLRNYVNAESGERVSLGLLLGPSGPMSVHSPDICYSAQAYTPVDEAEQIRVHGQDGAEGEFWKQTFRSRNLNGDLIRVYYAWKTGDEWSAPKGARLELAKYPYLHKVQVVAPLVDVDAETDPARDFLGSFLSAADAVLEDR